MTPEPEVAPKSRDPLTIAVRLPLGLVAWYIGESARRSIVGPHVTLTQVLCEVLQAAQPPR